LKSLLHLFEEQQTSTIDSLVNKISSTFSSPTSSPVAFGEPELLASQVVTLVSQSERTVCLKNHDFSDNTDISVTVSYNELVVAELSQYKSGKPLEWWNNHQHSYFNLSRMVRKYLVVVVTSVPSERLFSTTGDIVTAKRCALEPENVEKLVILRDNLL